MKLHTPNLYIIRQFLLGWILLSTVACAPNYHKWSQNYTVEQPVAVPDYTRLDYWAAHPWKHDPSDSLPEALKDEPKDSLVDVFFIYPTTYIKKTGGWNADINDPDLNARTDYTTILYQASVFNQHARLFAPRYRQANFQAFFTDDPQALAAFDTAYTDVRNAFLEYLHHYNNGRPIIIAGHSQGAKMCEYLLKEFVDGKALHQQLVATYIIGWPVPDTFFKTIPVCQSPDQTGCFCSWRTLREGYLTDYMKKETFTAPVTNPLSWTTSTTPVPRSANKGSVLRNFSKIVPHTTNGRIQGNVLWVDRPKFPGSMFYRAKNYHIADINLFYINLRTNIENRITTFLKASSK
ncbi:MAG TPA: DUF3089 domain-containing protein [Flavisolibacter sp.]|jgi:hypothetical protein|nr:DUF3089 domain-containing protein [Flavisolibacter sp.]